MSRSVNIVPMSSDGWRHQFALGLQQIRMKDYFSAHFQISAVHYKHLQLFQYKSDCCRNVNSGEQNDVPRGPLQILHGD